MRDLSNKITRNDSSSNTSYVGNKIKLNMHRGVLNGNILPYTPPPEPISCQENSLDFSCAENSQYVGII